MNEKRTKQLFSAIEQTEMQPTDEFVARLRQRIADEVNEFGSAAIGDDHEMRGTTMVDVPDENTENPRWSRGRLGLVAGGLIAAGVVGVLVLQAIRTNEERVEVGPADDAESITAPALPVSGLGEDPDAAAAFAVVEDAYMAHESGDAEAWFIARSAGSDFPNEGARRELEDFVAASIAFGEEIEVVECQSLGFGDWPGILDSGEAATGFRFRCESTRSEPVQRVAGVRYMEVVDWIVSEGQVIGVISEEDLSEVEPFELEFRRWIRTNHPEDVALSAREVNLPRLLELVDEFVTQSEDYPLNES